MEHLFIDCLRLCSKKNSCWLKILSEFLFSSKILYYFYSALKYSLNIWILNFFYKFKLLMWSIIPIHNRYLAGTILNFFSCFLYKSNTCKIKVIFIKHICLKTQIKVYFERIFDFKGSDLYQIYFFGSLFDINNSFQWIWKMKTLYI